MPISQMLQLRLKEFPWSSRSESKKQQVVAEIQTLPLSHWPWQETQQTLKGHETAGHRTWRAGWLSESGHKGDNSPFPTPWGHLVPPPPPPQPEFLEQQESRCLQSSVSGDRYGLVPWEARRVFLLLFMQSRQGEMWLCSTRGPQLGDLSCLLPSELA